MKSAYGYGIPLAGTQSIPAAFILGLKQNLTLSDQQSISARMPDG
jgi:hypothetical protein